MNKFTLLIVSLITLFSFTSCESNMTQETIYRESLLYNCQWKAEGEDVLVFKPEHMLIKNASDISNWTLCGKNDSKMMFYHEDLKNKAIWDCEFDIIELSDSSLVLYGPIVEKEKCKTYHYKKCK